MPYEFLKKTVETEQQIIYVHEEKTNLNERNIYFMHI
jgi:hypothetical protein